MASKKEKLRARLAATKPGWSHRDLFKLLAAHGFVSREGSKHTVYQHEQHTDLTLVAPRAREMLPVYLREAERLLDELDQRSKTKGGGS